MAIKSLKLVTTTVDEDGCGEGSEREVITDEWVWDVVLSGFVFLIIRCTIFTINVDHQLFLS